MILSWLLCYGLQTSIQIAVQEGSPVISLSFGGSIAGTPGSAEYILSSAEAVPS